LRKARFRRVLLTFLFSLSFLYGEKEKLDADLTRLRDGETAFQEVERLFRADDMDVTVNRAWVFRAPQRVGVAGGELRCFCWIQLSVPHDVCWR
jgi:hypothetical protein